MEWIKEYIIAVVSAGIICGICVALTEKNKSTGAIIKMICSVFMALTLISPLVQVRLSDLGQIFEDISSEGEALAKEGDQLASEELSAVIKTQLESYILDKAESMNLKLEVNVSLDRSSDPPLPEQVEMKGSVSAYHRAVLSQYITRNLGITEAQLQWN